MHEIETIIQYKTKDKDHKMLANMIIFNCIIVEVHYILGTPLSCSRPNYI